MIKIENKRQSECNRKLPFFISFWPSNLNQISIIALYLEDKSEGNLPVNATFKRIKVWDFPGVPVVKNPPANAGDMGSIPGQGGLHVLWGN